MRLARWVSTATVIATVMLIGACGWSSAPPATERSTDRSPGSTPAAPIHADASTSSTAASSTTLSHRAAACSYISRTEMAEMLGAPIGRPSADEEKEGTTSCVYPPADAGSSSQAEVTIEGEHGGTPSFERLLLSAFGGSAPGRQLAHNIQLGDDA